MTTINELNATLSAAPGVILCRWFDNRDEEDYNNYNGIGFVSVRRFVVWLNDDTTCSEEIVVINAMDGNAHWKHIPILLRPAPEPSTFETALASAIKGLPAAVVRTNILDMNVSGEYAVVKAYTKTGTSPNITIVGSKYFAYSNPKGSTTIVYCPYSGD